MKRLLHLAVLLSMLAGCGSSPHASAPVGRHASAIRALSTGRAQPTLFAQPTLLSGSPTVGQVLSSSNGTWGHSPVSFRFQWFRCDTAGLNCAAVTTLSSANTYTVVLADVGSTLRVHVTATNPAGSATQRSAATDTVVAGGTPSFVAGVCSPACTTPTFTTNYNVSAADSASAPICGTVCGTGSPLTLSLPFSVTRPGNLQASPKPPLVILFDDTQSAPAHAHWLAAAAAHGFVVAQALNVGGTGVTVLNFPSIFKPTTSGSFQCGTNSNRHCDGIPYVKAIIDAVNCSGALPCEDINPNEIYVEGGSHGATMAEDVMCDTRTAALVHGIQVTSSVFFSATTGTFTNTTAPISCPALFGPPSPCNYDCVSITPVTNQSWQWLWGTDDTQFVDSTNCPWTSPAGSNGSNCMGTGYTSSSGPYWVFGNNYLAQSRFGQQGLGCSTTPASTVTSGLTSNTLTTTYSTCANAPNPSITATQTVQITKGLHLPEGPSCQAGATEALCNYGDGISTPNAAYAFWSTYPAL